MAKAGETKEVTDGYGRHFLIPRRLAVLADANATNILERQRKVEVKIATEQAGLARQLDGKEVTLKAKTGAEDKFFGAITAADIATELQKVTGIAVDKRKIELAEPIRQLGNYEIDIKLGKEAIAKIQVAIIGEEASHGEQ